MGGPEVIVPLASMFFGTLMCLGFFVFVYALIAKRPGRSAALNAEIQALREEVASLRKQNNDVVLAVDQSLDSVNRRMDALDLRVRSQNQPASEAAQQTINRS